MENEQKELIFRRNGFKTPRHLPYFMWDQSYFTFKSYIAMKFLDIRYLQREIFISLNKCL